MAILPRFWEGGEDFYMTLMALQKHFSDTCHGAEATIDLKGRMQGP